MELEALEKKIKKEFKNAEKEVIKKADLYFEQFKKADKKMLKMYKSGEITKKEYIAWRKKKMTVGDEFKKLEITIAGYYVNATLIANKMINDNIPYSFTNALNYATFEIEKMAKVNTSFTIIDEGTVTSLIKDNPNLLPKAKLPKGVMRWNVGKVNSALLQGIIAGDDINKIANRLSAVTNQAGASSIRTARTLTTASEVWIATEDSRTRHSHAILDGEEQEAEDTFSNGCKFPADPDGEPKEIYNCRCTMKSKIESISYSDAVYKDSKVASMSYDRWKRSRR